MPSMSRRLLAIGLGIGCVAAGLGTLATAGPLSPPVGAVSSTYKTLTEVEPRIAIQSLAGNATFEHRIITAGSYYLTGNLTVSAGQGGIEVAVDNVTIDLNGFRITGVSGSGDGIFGTSVIDNVTIRNGSILTMGGDGIELSGRRYRIENVTVTGNTGRGIAVGDAAVITGVVADANGQIGIQAGNDTVIENCVASGNAEGISAGVACMVRACSAVANATRGISIGLGGSAVDCTVKDMTPAGSRGINVGDGGFVSRCVVRNVTGTGVWLNGGGTMVDSSVSFNAAGVLAFGNNGTIARNQITDNITAGVRMEGADYRVSDNNFNDNDIGVQTIGNGGNLIFHNTFSGNTSNSALGINDRFGPFRILAAGALPAATDYNENLVY